MRLIAVVLSAVVLTAVTAQAAPTSSLRSTAETVAAHLLAGQTDELLPLALDYEQAARSLSKVEKRGRTKYDAAMRRHLDYLAEQLAEGKQQGELALKRVELLEVVTAPAGGNKRKTDIVLGQTRAVFALDGKETAGLEICFMAVEGRWQLVHKCR